MHELWKFEQLIDNYDLTNQSKEYICTNLRNIPYNASDPRTLYYNVYYQIMLTYMYYYNKPDNAW